jgi:hypothetical protein
MRKSIGLLFLVAFMISLVGSAVAFAGKVVDPTAKRRPAVPGVKIEKKMNATTTSTTIPTVTVIQQDGFEDTTLWSKGGCWEIGTPTYGPALVVEGFNSAGRVCHRAFIHPTPTIHCSIYNLSIYRR